MGFESVASGPLVRSSYHADEQVPRAARRHGPLAYRRLDARPLGFRTVIPLRDNIPTDRFPVVTARDHRDQRVRVPVPPGPVVLAVERRAASTRSRSSSTARSRTGSPIPARSACSGAARTTSGSGDSLVCEGTPEYREARQRGRSRSRTLPQPPAFLTIFTSMFMHGGWLHIVFNMLFLWIFGNNVEDSMGRLRFVVFYLLGGLAAALTQVAVIARLDRRPRSGRAARSPRCSAATRCSIRALGC